VDRFRQTRDRFRGAFCIPRSAVEDEQHAIGAGLAALAYGSPVEGVDVSWGIEGDFLDLLSVADDDVAARLQGYVDGHPMSSRERVAAEDLLDGLLRDRAQQLAARLPDSTTTNRAWWVLRTRNVRIGDGLAALTAMFRLDRDLWAARFATWVWLAATIGSLAVAGWLTGGRRPLVGYALSLAWPVASYLGVAVAQYLDTRFPNFEMPGVRGEDDIFVLSVLIGIPTAVVALITIVAIVLEPLADLDAPGSWLRLVLDVDLGITLLIIAATLPAVLIARIGRSIVRLVARLRRS
jgi:hypothetical protein